MQPDKLSLALLLTPRLPPLGDLLLIYMPNISPLSSINLFAVYPDQLDFVDRVLETCYNVSSSCILPLYTHHRGSFAKQASDGLQCSSRHACCVQVLP